MSKNPETPHTPRPRKISRAAATAGAVAVTGLAGLLPATATAQETVSNGNGGTPVTAPTPSTSNSGGVAAGETSTATSTATVGSEAAPESSQELNLRVQQTVSSLVQQIGNLGSRPDSHRQMGITYSKDGQGNELATLAVTVNGLESKYGSNQAESRLYVTYPAGNSNKMPTGDNIYSLTLTEGIAGDGKEANALTPFTTLSIVRNQETGGFAVIGQYQSFEGGNGDIREASISPTLAGEAQLDTDEFNHFAGQARSMLHTAEQGLKIGYRHPAFDQPDGSVINQQ